MYPSLSGTIGAVVGSPSFTYWTTNGSDSSSLEKNLTTCSSASLVSIIRISTTVKCCASNATSSVAVPDTSFSSTVVTASSFAFAFSTASFVETPSFSTYEIWIKSASLEFSSILVPENLTLTVSPSKYTLLPSGVSNLISYAITSTTFADSIDGSTSSCAALRNCDVLVTSLTSSIVSSGNTPWPADTSILIPLITLES